MTNEKMQAMSDNELEKVNGGHEHLHVWGRRNTEKSTVSASSSPTYGGATGSW